MLSAERCKVVKCTCGSTAKHSIPYPTAYATNINVQIHSLPHPQTLPLPHPESDIFIAVLEFYVYYSTCERVGVCVCVWLYEFYNWNVD